MNPFWFLFALYEALMIGGALLASIPSWLTKGIPHHTETFWTILIFWGVIVTLLLSAFLARLTLKSSAAADEEDPHA